VLLFGSHARGTADDGSDFPRARIEDRDVPQADETHEIARAALSDEYA
jgi:hypothetical protein